jgi:hypothetical protein
VFGDHRKIAIGCQHRQIVTEAKLRQESVDCADLDAAAAASVSEFRRVDMVMPVRDEQWQGGEPFDDLRSVPRPGKPLQELLQNEAGCQQLLAGLDGPHQLAYFRRRGWCVAPQRQRPDAGIDEEAQLRERAAL